MPHKILNSELINPGAYIDGLFENLSKKYTVYNPASGKMIYEVSCCGEQEAQRAVGAASKAFASWSKMLPKARAKLLIRLYNQVKKYKKELAEIITYENGKTLDESLKEVDYGRSFLKWFAEEAVRIEGGIFDGVKEGQKIINCYEPMGPVAAITPWNFPFAMIARKLAPALAAGCTIVIKPSEMTPLSALALATLCERAGIPAGVVNIISGDVEEIGEVLTSDPRIKKLTFTGSTRVGKMLNEKASRSLKRVSLELGGNAPFIVFPDSCNDKTIDALINAKIRSSGQACTSVNRVLVHENIYNEFLAKMAERFSKLKVGNGLDADTDIGPIINKVGIDKILHLIEEAKSQGATIVCGGNVKNESLFMNPTILSNCKPDMKIFRKEIFGPVLAFYKFSTVEEAIELANATDYGLSAYVFSQHHETIWRMVNALDFGMVGVNESIVSNEIGAFGGRKDSGFGIEGSSRGIYEFMNAKYINLN